MRDEDWDWEPSPGASPRARRAGLVLGAVLLIPVVVGVVAIPVVVLLGNDVRSRSVPR